MELRHLRYFVAVGQALNFTKAAMRLHLAQPALSRQVSDLEDELGVDLLKRTSHGVLLTPEGKVFLEAARGILQGVDDSVTKVRAHGPSRRASSTAHRADGAIAEIGYALDTLKMDGVTTIPPTLKIFWSNRPETDWLCRASTFSPTVAHGDLVLHAHSRVRRGVFKEKLRFLLFDFSFFAATERPTSKEGVNITHK
jgi:hypothetical protein